MAYVITAAAYAVIAGTAMSVYGQIEGAKAAEAAAEEEARQLKLAAQSKELARREELNRVLSQQIVAFASEGIEAEGSPSSIALESAKNIGESEGLESVSNKLALSLIERQGKATKAAGYTQAASTLLSSGSALLGASNVLGSDEGE